MLLQPYNYLEACDNPPLCYDFSLLDAYLQVKNISYSFFVVCLLALFHSSSFLLLNFSPFPSSSSCRYSNPLFKQLSVLPDTLGLIAIWKVIIYLCYSATTIKEFSFFSDIYIAILSLSAVHSLLLGDWVTNLELKIPYLLDNKQSPGNTTYSIILHLNLSICLPLFAIPSTTPFNHVIFYPIYICASIQCGFLFILEYWIIFAIGWVVITGQVKCNGVDNNNSMEATLPIGMFFVHTSFRLPYSFSIR